jgi:hypothetical protein
VEYVTNNSFIQLAIDSEDFCKSSKKAFYMTIRNPARMGLSSQVRFIVHAIGKGLVVGGSTFFCYMMVYGTKGDEVSNKWLPITLVVIYSWIVASMFISVFSYSA